MAIVMRGKWLLAGLGVLIVAVLAAAWVAGGREEPIREISQPIPVPDIPG